MPIEYKRNSTDVNTDLTQISKDFGFTRTDRFIGAFTEYFSDLFGDIYSEVYDLDPETRIDTASDDYLDSYGVLLDEERNRVIILEDLSLDNAYIITEDGLPVSNYTVGAQPITVPAGSNILDANGTPMMQVLDTVTYANDRIFIRVIGEDGVFNIPAGTYTLDGSIEDFALVSNNSSIVDSQLLTTPTLQVILQTGITGVEPGLDDDEYRFVLYEKSISINLANKSKVRTLLSDRRVARFVIKEFSSGSSSVTVYIEPVNGLLNKALELTIRTALDRLLPDGTVIHVARMVPSRIDIDLDIKIPNTVAIADRDIIISQLKTLIVTEIAGLTSNSVLLMDDIRDLVLDIDTVDEVFINGFIINGDKIFENFYAMRNIEFLFTDDKGITIKIA